MSTKRYKSGYSKLKKKRVEFFLLNHKKKLWINL